MALWIDFIDIGLDELSRYDSNLPSVLSIEDIGLDKKQELSHQLITNSLDQTLPASEWVGHVVVNEPLRRWHAIQTLALIYRDAYFLRLSDRYKLRQESLFEEVRNAKAEFLSNALPIVTAPIPKAPRPELSLDTGSLPIDAYYVVVAFADGTGEGEASDVASIALPDIGGLSLRIVTDHSSYGLRVYAGNTTESMSFQVTQAGDLSTGEPGNNHRRRFQARRRAESRPRYSRRAPPAARLDSMSIYNQALSSVAALLQGDAGLLASIRRQSPTDNLPMPGVSAGISSNIPIEMADVTATSYPQIVVYCERVKNSLDQKFTQFSGTADVVIELRVSEDSPDRLGRSSTIYINALLDLLNISRGQLSEAVYFGGQYEVQFLPLRKVRTNLFQTSRVKISINLRLE